MGFRNVLGTLPSVSDVLQIFATYLIMMIINRAFLVADNLHFEKIPYRCGPVSSVPTYCQLARVKSINSKILC
jgi:hypothetical protein